MMQLMEDGRDQRACCVGGQRETGYGSRSAQNCAMVLRLRLTRAERRRCIKTRWCANESDTDASDC
jgi:hypothetical protein